MKEPLTEEQQALAVEAWPFAMQVARKFSKKHFEYSEDFESACGLAACEAASTWKPELGIKLKTHVGNRANGACLDVLRRITGFGTSRKRRILPMPISLQMQAYYGSRNEDSRPLQIADTLASNEEPIGWELESYDEVKALTRRFEPKTRMALRLWSLHAVCECSQRGVGDVMNRSESRVSQILKLAKEQSATS